ncbi:amidohydrolase [Halalkalibacillus sediminis]|uniref:Amidohydrolase n=1 Tax=Halalkalibacillus sediminis TaxID=2018042 RepID=A0A2I0QVT3_9BACI|nr:M20 family metallopeptidase [Halalkalibacillus sediminis]PKR78424.1 amidohydrolase [Halalkalibacillus sediminis]
MENLLSNEEIKEIEEDLISWYKHFHQNPELSFQEKNTSEYVIDQLEDFGDFTIHKNIGGYGIVAELGKGTPVVGLRADMDALPIKEQTDLPFASVNDGVMHACGHDAHTAMLLGAARILSIKYKENRLKGTVKFIFQPAEEDTDEYGLTGAPYMLQSGLLDDVQSAFALHVCPWRSIGEIQLNDGPSMANIDNFYIELSGVGSHGAYPHQGKDPIWLMNQLLSLIYSVPGRQVDPLDPAVISVGQIHAGQATNVIPDVVTMRGSIRSYSKSVQQSLLDELERSCRSIEALGCDIKLIIEHGEPALHNDPDTNRKIEQFVQENYPQLSIVKKAYGLGSEDFSHILEKVPGAMVMVGCHEEGQQERHLHGSDFQVDERVLSIGTSLLVGFVEKNADQS